MLYATLSYKKQLDLDSTIKFLRNQSEYKIIDTDEQNINENRIKRIEHTRYQGETQRGYMNQKVAECEYCREKHKVRSCNRFSQLTPGGILNIARERNLCMN
jgi:hypothetical protein